MQTTGHESAEPGGADRSMCVMYLTAHDTCAGTGANHVRGRRQSRTVCGSQIVHLHLEGRHRPLACIVVAARRRRRHSNVYQGGNNTALRHASQVAHVVVQGQPDNGMAVTSYSTPSHLRNPSSGMRVSSPDFR